MLNGVMNSISVMQQWIIQNKNKMWAQIIKAARMSGFLHYEKSYQKGMVIIVFI